MSCCGGGRKRANGGKLFSRPKSPEELAAEYEAGDVLLKYIGRNPLHVYYGERTYRFGVSADLRVGFVAANDADDMVIDGEFVQIEIPDNVRRLCQL